MIKDIKQLKADKVSFSSSLVCVCVLTEVGFDPDKAVFSCFPLFHCEWLLSCGVNPDDCVEAVLVLMHHARLSGG